MTRSNHLLSLLTLVLVAAACTSSGDNAKPATQTSDSAGVALAISNAPAWKPGEEWTISPAPVVQIGAQGSDTLHQFTSIRSIVRFGNGDLAVANGRPYFVRVYNAEGKYIRDVGRQGQGPGEYQYVNKLSRMTGDSLFVSTERGINPIFGTDGKFVRSVKLERAPRDFAEFAATPWARGVFSDGSILMIAGVSGGPGTSRTPGLSVSSLEFNRYSSAGKLLNSLGVFDDYEVFVAGDESYVRSYSPERVWSISGDKLYTGNGREFEVRVYEMGGALRRIMRIDTPAIRVTADTIAKRKASRLAVARTPEDRQRIEKIYSIMDFPDSLPHFDDMVAAEDGSVWVKRWTSIAPRRWYVFDKDGRWLGSLDLPDRFAPSGMSGDLVFGVGRDADDVESVHVYSIRKGGG